MCGIIGCNYKANNFIKAIDLITHRGPDNKSILSINDNLLGHTRLSIIDLDEEANQPMEFDNIVIVFNGEIYNYKELIKEHNLKVVTRSDTEVIIRLYQKYKYDFLNYLNGMFSFCIYDKNKKNFFCARDRFGKKPFFYYNKNKKFIFASEIKAILKLLDFTPDINNDALIEFFRFSSPIYDNSIYKDIKKLPAGYYLTYDGNLKIKKYYDITISDHDLNEKKAIEKIEELFFDSVRMRLNSDVEVATFLSGGIDSSLVSSIYSKLSNKKINTYSIGYDEYKNYCELDYAKIVSKHINSNHNEMIISKKDFIECFENMFDMIDEPFGDTAIIPTMMLSKKINKDGIKVVLSGEGSDEIFLGYDNYFKMLEYFNNNFKNETFNLTKEWEYKRRKIENEPIFYSTGETFTNGQLELILKNFKNLNLPYNINTTPLKQMNYFDFKYWIENVLMTKIDRATMRYSLEARAPFLDYRLVELLFSINDNIKMGNTNKHLLKKIASKYLPKEIVYRRKKGFSSPFMEWLFDEYKDKLLDDILEVNKITNFFKEEFVRFLYNEAKENRFKQHFYNIYIFTRWYKKIYL